MRLYPLFAFVLATAGACVPMGQYGGAGAGSPSSGTAPGAPEPGAPAPSSGEPAGAAASAPAGPTTVSVSIRSSCPKTVKVFFGEKPKFGSGTQSSVDSNSVSNHTFQTGDMFWIVDDEENGVASTTIQATTHEIEIGSSCTELQVH